MYKNWLTHAENLEYSSSQISFILEFNIKIIKEKEIILLERSKTVWFGNPGVATALVCL